MIVAILMCFGILAALGVGAHSIGMPHLFYLSFIPIAKIMVICLVIGWCLCYIFS
jgi:hypothetical protein